MNLSSKRIVSYIYETYKDLKTQQSKKFIKASRLQGHTNVKHHSLRGKALSTQSKALERDQSWDIREAPNDCMIYNYYIICPRSNIEIISEVFAYFVRVNKQFKIP